MMVWSVMVWSVRVFAAASLLGALSGSIACGQVVQLPDFRRFDVQTSVLVPDRGGALLGGTGRSASHGTVQGVPGVGRLPAAGRLLGNRALGQASGTSAASVHVTILDQEALDRAVLAAAASRRSVPTSVDQRAAALTRRMQMAGGAAHTAAAAPLRSVAELRREHAARQARQTDEAIALLDRGQQAAARGQVSTARIYYRMAEQRASGALQRQIAAHRAALGAASP